MLSMVMETHCFSWQTRVRGRESRGRVVLGVEKCCQTAKGTGLVPGWIAIPHLGRPYDGDGVQSRRGANPAQNAKLVGMRLPTYRSSSRVSINMTPMIDVTFLLIIFFLVSSHLAQQENFLPLDLPTAESSIADFSDRPTLTIQIPKDGTYQVNGASLALDQVRIAILTRVQVEGGDPIRIRIRTDQSVPYASIAKLLKVCALTGNSDIVFAVYEGVEG